MAGGAAGLLGQGRPAGTAATLALQCVANSAGPTQVGLALRLALALRKIARGLAAGALTGATLSGRRQPHPGTPGLGETDGDGLLGIAGTMLALADVVHFFSDKLPRLGGGGFAAALIGLRPLQGGFLRHMVALLTPGRAAPGWLCHQPCSPRQKLNGV